MKFLNPLGKVFFFEGAIFLQSGNWGGFFKTSFFFEEVFLRRFLKVLKKVRKRMLLRKRRNFFNSYFRRS